MTVSETIQLPAQPADGVHRIVGLGGDGGYSPKSCGHTRAELQGDGSSGTIQLKLELDPNFQHMVYIINASVAFATEATTVQALIQLDPRVRYAYVMECVPNNVDTGGLVSCVGLWRPPAVITSSLNDFRPFVQVNTANVAANKLRIDMMTLQFAPGAREIAPWQWLTSSFPS